MAMTPPQCATCHALLVVRQSGSMTVILCWRCRHPAVIACSEARALAEWQRQEAERRERR
jgi:hypothetical protein